MSGDGFSCASMDCITEDTDTGVRVNSVLSKDIQERRSALLETIEEFKKMGESPEKDN